MPYFRPPDLLAGFIAVRPDPALPELIMVGEQWGPRGQRIAEHAHEDWEFYYQAQGVSRWRVGRKVFVLQPGKLFVAPPGLRHELAGPQAADHHYFFVSAAVATCLGRLGPGLKAAFADPQPGVWDEGGGLRPAFEGLVREVSLLRPWRTEALKLALDTLILEVARTLGGGEGVPVGRHPALARALRLLEQRPEARWPVATLARLAGVSAPHLTTLFRKELATTPHAHALALRLDRAAELLRRGDISVTRIASDLGFSSSQHLATAFRRRFGKSPREHSRKKHGS